MNMKQCKRCGTITDQFYGQKRNKDGLRPYCKSCDNANYKETMKRNKELLVRRKLKMKAKCDKLMSDLGKKMTKEQLLNFLIDNYYTKIS